MPDNKKGHEVAERIADEFGKDCKKMRVFKHEDGSAQIDGRLKRFIPPDEFRERAKDALKGMEGESE